MNSLNSGFLPPPPEGTAGWPWSGQTSEVGGVMPDVRAWPKISVVTPSYNQGQFIEATLRSVLLQGYPNLEYIVMDGGSTDESVEIIKKYAPWLTYWISQRDQGQSNAINNGFARATGAIYAWLNSDDIYLPGALQRIAAAYSDAPEAAAWVGDCYWVTQELRVIKLIEPRGLNKDDIGDWWYSGFFMQPSCFFSPSAWKQAGGLDETLRYALDLDLWLKIASTGPFQRVADALSAALIHTAAKTQAEIPQMNAETAYVQFKHGYREAATNRLVSALSKNSATPAAPPSIRDALRRRVGELLSRVRGNAVVDRPRLSDVLSK